MLSHGAALLHWLYSTIHYWLIRCRTYSSLFSLKTFAAQLLGFPNYIPPNARTRGPALLRGVNYASGAAGIRDETGNNLVFICIGSLNYSLNRNL
jgi:hypothetical protein